MKKVLLILAIALGMSSIAEAQIAKGKKMLGGNASLGFSNTNIQINPRVGMFMTDDIAVGAGIQFGMVDNGVNTTTSFGLDVSARKFWSAGENLYFYGHAGLVYGNNNASSIAINLYPGVTYFFNDRLAIDGALAGLGGGGIGLMLLF